MDRLRKDLTVTIRRLRSSPGFTIAAIVTLALGIGANATIFTAVNALIFRSLAVDHPEELVSLNTSSSSSEYPVQSYPNYIDMRDRNDVFSGLASYRPQPVNFSRGDGNNARVWGYEVTGNYFDVLGVHALRGRLLHPEDDRVRGASPVVVIGYSFWQRRFSGDPDVAGKKIKLNGMDYTVVGVTPRAFTGTEMIYTPDIFVPMSMVAQIEPGNTWINDRGSFNSFVVGRMKPGVTMPQAEAALNTIMADLAREYPKENAGMHVVLSPPGLFGSFLRDYIRIFAAVLMGLAGVVLLIACVNLASLLLARATDRRRDTAIRLALGAARGDLIRQLLTESIVLSILGGAAGVLLAVWLTQLFAAWKPPMDIPVIPQLGLDWHVLAFAAAASLGTGVVFGLAPAIQSVRVDLAPALKNEAVAQRLRRFHLRDLLVTAQIAMSVVLLVGSLLVVRSLQNALSVKLGFEPRGAATVAFDLALEGYNETRAKDFQRRLMQRVRALPGIEAAGITDSVPLSLNWNNDVIFIEGRPQIKVGDAPLAPMFVIDPGYLKAMRTPLVAGRNFDDHDRQGAPKVAIVNQAFAAQLLPGENPLGKRFRASRQEEGPWYQIVGIVENGKYRSLGESAKPAVFRPLDQEWSSYTQVIARSSLPEERVASMLRSAVLELDPNITLYDNGSLTSELGLVLLPARLAAGVLGSFGLLAIVLAATGVYGIMAYAVARRTREIGIRMALGARQATVLRVVLSHTAVLMVIGTGVGIGLSLAAGRVFSQILYGISATDPFTYLISILLMAAIAAIACLVPARRAISVDPVTALRDC